MLNSLRFGESATRPPAQQFSVAPKPEKAVRVQSKQLRGVTKRQEDLIPTVFAPDIWTIVPVKKTQLLKSCVLHPERPPPSLV